HGRSTESRRAECAKRHCRRFWHLIERQVIHREIGWCSRSKLESQAQSFTRPASYIRVQAAPPARSRHGPIAACQETALVSEHGPMNQSGVPTRPLVKLERYDAHRCSAFRRK